jgi:YVTN family beta-propeller protein
MSPRRCFDLIVLPVTLSLLAPAGAHALGARLSKSGPIGITADGAFVWVVNSDHDSVSRIDTAAQAATVFALPGPGPHKPAGLAVTADGSQVWVAAHDSDTVFVLDGQSGAVAHAFAMPTGSGPMAAAISPDEARVVVTLHRAGAAAVFDAAAVAHTATIQGLFRRPWGVAFTSNPDEAWVVHTVTEGEDSVITALDLAALNVKARVILKSVDPKDSNAVQSNYTPKVAEGGYILTRGHPAQPPGVNQLWFPLQYQNFHNPAFNPDSTVQSVVHKIDLATLKMLNDPGNTSHRLVLSAKESHQGNTRIGDGWNAGISGPQDMAFNAAGTTAYLIGEYSNDVLVFPTNVTRVKPAGAQPLTEIAVGNAPTGLVASPAAERLYVLNSLSRDVSVIDTLTNTELARIPATPGHPEPLAAGILNGARLFNLSSDPRISSNAKMSCASCHVDGDGDALMWDFAQFGAGSRKTLRLRGLSLAFAPGAGGLGQLHRSGDRDEVQDFDHTFRAVIMGGTGFIPGTPHPSLGPPNAGLSADLDDIAAYVLSLEPTQRSPHRDADGSLSPAARRGAMIFKNAAPQSPYNVGCAGCHPAPAFTDFDYHDVGGHTPGTELEGPPFNTPSLVGAWDDAPYVQTVGWPDGQSLGGVIRSAADPAAQAGIHGDASGLNRAQRRDLEAFLNSIDGRLAEEGIGSVVDGDPPHVVALLPVSLQAVEVVFDEAVDPVTASNPANYVLTDGLHDTPATAAQVNSTWGNRVRLAVDLASWGCPVTYTLLPGPIKDLAFETSNGGVAANVLDTADAANHKSFELDGTITVTFGDGGLETFSGAATDAGIVAGLNSWSHARWWLADYTSPKPMIGFIRFDFASALTGDCGLTASSAIVDARLTVRPEAGHRNTIELRRVYKPWNAPPNDWYSGCGGVVTMDQAQCGQLNWAAQGATSLGGDGTNPGHYYPASSAFDRAAVADASATIDGMNEALEFSGPAVTSAFRLWFDNPALNNGYAASILDSCNYDRSTIFWGAEQEAGLHGPVLTVTYSVAAESAPDCNANGVADFCDVTSGGFDDLNSNGIPDVCERGECIVASTCADGDANGVSDDSCKWFSCIAGTCQALDRHFADLGGAFGACPPDGAADGNDRFHALNCFADVDTAGQAGYPCETSPPLAFNADAGGLFGDCQPDGVCDGHDAFHVLAAFDHSTACSCPLDGPAPAMPPAAPAIAGRAGLELRAANRAVRPGGIVEVDAFLTGAIRDLRGYQLHVEASGGSSGHLQLVDILIRRFSVFSPAAEGDPGERRATSDERLSSTGVALDERRATSDERRYWSAFNIGTQQMLAGLDGPGVPAPSGAYLATFVFRASEAAGGLFSVDLLHDERDPQQRTFLFATAPGGRIAIEHSAAATIVVSSKDDKLMSRR